MAQSSLQTRLNWARDVDSFEKRLNINAYNKSMRTQAQHGHQYASSASKKEENSGKMVQDYTSGCSAYYHALQNRKV